MTPMAHLLVIDPQNDFCDLPADRWPDARTAPALPVAGADADLRRLAAFVRAAGDSLSDITITLDSHQRLDIAHPGFWRQGDGAPVPPFTEITAEALRDGRFQTRDPGDCGRALAYLEALERRGRYRLMVWPVHCETGGWGHEVHAELRAACTDWEARHRGTLREFTKGENPWTEHYSAILAEVPDADDPRTQLNHGLLARLAPAGRILIAGEASSHCVRATTEDLVAHLGDPPRLTLLTDCMSAVAGFAEQAQGFFAGMRARGVQVATADEALAAWR